MKKYFILSVDDEICNRYFEDFVCKEFGMDVCSVGFGTTEFTCTKKPRNFEKRLLKRFGTITEGLTQWNYLEGEI